MQSLPWKAQNTVFKGSLYWHAPFSENNDRQKLFKLVQSWCDPSIHLTAERGRGRKMGKAKGQYCTFALTIIWYKKIVKQMIINWQKRPTSTPE